MGNREEYLKAKKVVEKYETIEKRFIAVISLDTKDFCRWKLKNKLIGGGISKIREFKVGNLTYRCISTVCNTCSLTIDSIMETENAKENEEYDEIRSILNQNSK